MARQMSGSRKIELVLIAMAILIVATACGGPPKGDKYAHLMDWGPISQPGGDSTALLDTGAAETINGAAGCGGLVVIGGVFLVLATTIFGKKEGE